MCGRHSRFEKRFLSFLCFQKFASYMAFLNSEIGNICEVGRRFVWEDCGRKQLLASACTVGQSKCLKYFEIWPSRFYIYWIDRQIRDNRMPPCWNTTPIHGNVQHVVNWRTPQLDNRRMGSFNTQSMWHRHYGVIPPDEIVFWMCLRGDELGLYRWCLRLDSINCS